jgi:ketosteroid isomerase-like protein
VSEESTSSLAGGLGGVYEGREAIRSVLEAWIGPFEGYEQVVKEFRDLGSGVTLNVDLTRGRPIGGSGFLVRRFAAVLTWRDGLIERGPVYPDSDRARADAERLAKERG